MDVIKTPWCRLTLTPHGIGILEARAGAKVGVQEMDWLLATFEEQFAGPFALLSVRRQPFHFTLAAMRRAMECENLLAIAEVMVPGQVSQPVQYLNELAVSVARLQGRMVHTGMFEDLDSARAWLQSKLQARARRA